MTAREELMELVGAFIERERHKGLPALTNLEAGLLTTLAAMAHGQCRARGINPKLPEARASFLRACELAWDEMSRVIRPPAEKGMH